MSQYERESLMSPCYCILLSAIFSPRYIVHIVVDCEGHGKRSLVRCSRVTSHLWCWSFETGCQCIKVSLNKLNLQALSIKGVLLYIDTHPQRKQYLIHNRLLTQVEGICYMFLACFFPIHTKNIASMACSLHQ